MILVAHVLIALSGMLHATYLVIKPSWRQVMVSYAITGLTFASGTYLVISSGAPLLKSCLMGIAYLTITLASVAFAQHKLMAQSSRTNRSD